MERLTEKHYLGTDHYMKCSGNCNVDMDCIDCPSFDCLVERLAAYEDTGLTPEEVTALQKDWSDLCTTIGEYGGLDRVKELAEADKDGRVVVLPCKVGDTVWVTRNPWTGKLLKKLLDAYVNGMKMYSHGLYVNLLFDTRKINGTRDYEINHIGQSVFLAREEAEKALEAMKNA